MKYKQRKRCGRNRPHVMDVDDQDEQVGRGFGPVKTTRDTNLDRLRDQLANISLGGGSLAQKKKSYVMF